MFAPWEISTKIPSAQLLYTWLFVMVALCELPSIQRPTHALSWILEFLTVMLSVTHLKPPASLSHRTVGAVYASFVKLLWSISAPSIVAFGPSASVRPFW